MADQNATMKFLTRVLSRQREFVECRQFFDSLFSNKLGQCRKLHRTARSVVILDEAQILPTTLLAPCMSALRALRHYGTSIVMCTVTQPALGIERIFSVG